MVQNVEKFGAELGAYALGNGCCLAEGKVPVGIAGTCERVASELAGRAVGGGLERDRVEELIGALGGGAMGVDGTVKVGVDVRPYRVARVAGAGRVVAKLRRERETGLQVGDGGNGDARDEQVGKWAGFVEDPFPFAEGQVIASVDGEKVTNVGGSRAVIEAGVLRH